MRSDDDLAAAPATPLVLAILAEGDSYGYAILRRVRERSGGELAWADAMVYPLLHRLRRYGYLTSQWRTTPEGRRRRYYALTDHGHAAVDRGPQPRADARRAPVDRRRGTRWGFAVPLTP